MYYTSSLLEVLKTQTNIYMERPTSQFKLFPVIWSLIWEYMY